eukprot:9835065-Lingulodinium_polyedra.AAC.1
MTANEIPDHGSFRNAIVLRDLKLLHAGLVPQFHGSDTNKPNVRFCQARRCMIVSASKDTANAEAVTEDRG